MKFRNTVKMDKSTCSMLTKVGTGQGKVYLEFPNLDILDKKQNYAWHFQAFVELRFDCEAPEKLKQELDIQTQIGQELSMVFNHEATKSVKVGSYIHNATVVHDFYLEKSVGELSARSVNALMMVMSHRGFYFEINEDIDWEGSQHYFKILENKNLLDLSTPYPMAK